METPKKKTKPTDAKGQRSTLCYLKAQRGKELTPAKISRLKTFLQKIEEEKYLNVSQTKKAEKKFNLSAPDQSIISDIGLLLITEQVLHVIWLLEDGRG